MKRIIFVLILSALLSVKVYAITELPDLSNEHKAIGSDELHSSLPDDARQNLEDLEITPQNVTGIASFSPQTFIKAAVDQVKQQAAKPLQGFAVVMGVIILAALLDGFKSAASDTQINYVFGVTASLAICTATAEPIISCITDTSEAIRSCADFILSFIPVFAGVLTAGGQAVTASGYSLTLFAVCQVISKIAATVLIPIMGVYLGFSVIGAVSPQLKISSVANSFKNFVTWGLGLMLTIFVGFMSIQSIVAGSGDTVTTKTTKFLIGSFVPVVGGALSDAFIAAQGCINLLKATLGAYGIIAAIMIFLPSLVRLVLWYMVTMIGSTVSDIFDLKEVSGILKAMSTTLGILMAMILFFALLIIISTSVVLVVGQGGI